MIMISFSVGEGYSHPIPEGGSSVEERFSEETSTKERSGRRGSAIARFEKEREEGQLTNSRRESIDTLRADHKKVANSSMSDTLQ